MRIPLHLEKDYVSTSIIRVFHGSRFLGSITAIVDTGSPVTLLSEGDALKMRVPLNNLPFEKHQYGLGGASIELRKMEGVTFHVRNEADQVEKIELREIYVSKSPKVDETARRISQGTPTILGMDFLRSNRLALFLDPYREVAYLEKAEGNT